MSEKHAEVKGAAERSLLEQARALMHDSDSSGAFVLVREHWLANPGDLAAVRLLSEILMRSGRKDLFELLDRLSKNEYTLENDSHTLFETAYKFIDSREPELAVMLLTRCVNLHPEERMIRYELGFALMQMRRFLEAVPHFEYLAGIEEDFDTWLNLTVCHSIGRNFARARDGLNRLERLKSNDDEEREVALRRWVLKRMEKFEAPTPGVRDWVFSLYGAMLLSETSPRDLAGKPMNIATDYMGVATTLLVLRGLFAETGTEFDVIEYYNPLSRPLAEALARMMDLPAAPYGGPDRTERCLLTMAWASDIMGPHKAFANNKSSRSIFAYGLTTLTQLPVTPDIIGCMARECAMPWASQLENRPDVPAENISGQHPLNEIQASAVDKILENAANLECQPELIARVEDLAKYYGPRKEMLVFRNCEHFPVRPEYTAEIPG